MKLCQFFQNLHMDFEAWKHIHLNLSWVTKVSNRYVRWKFKYFDSVNWENVTMNIKNRKYVMNCVLTACTHTFLIFYFRFSNTTSSMDQRRTISARESLILHNHISLKNYCLLDINSIKFITYETSSFVYCVRKRNSCNLTMKSSEFATVIWWCIYSFILRVRKAFIDMFLQGIYHYWCLRYKFKCVPCTALFNAPDVWNSLAIRIFLLCT